MTASVDRKVTELDGPPSLGPLYTRAAAGAALPGGGGRELPAREIVRRGVTVEQDHLADYALACGFGIGGALPLTYPHVLAFPLQVVLMADRSFPLPLPGLVHLANRITAHRAVTPADTLDLRVHADRFVTHAKGAQVDLVAEARVGDEVVWEGRSTYLSRGAKASAEKEPGTDIAEAPTPTGTGTATWKVAGDTGRRYAAASGDVNPIHLHPLTAKAMGFPRAIAHGMWTAARAVAALQGRIPDAATYDVVFRKPLLLPSTVELVTEQDGDDWSLAVRAAKKPEKVHLAGRVTPA
ncbi:acyl dehydratase [Pseudonocardia sediminis]|uniref:Acyl dehydratase n=1 Tax=Pseudonocardia sediminis TaxID=1397368 RepID=A0A4Q7V5B2_PSEST|nr:MaoC/PaaZ C-terminal domain-containing protein [Pseudonocardia sediminis]RZT88908.1 acyl dehydratase [Pseudonocardia sediminis]